MYIPCILCVTDDGARREVLGRIWRLTLQGEFSGSDGSSKEGAEQGEQREELIEDEGAVQGVDTGEEEEEEEMAGEEAAAAPGSATPPGSLIHLRPPGTTSPPPFGGTPAPVVGAVSGGQHLGAPAAAPPPTDGCPLPLLQSTCHSPPLPSQPTTCHSLSQPTWQRPSSASAARTAAELLHAAKSGSSSMSLTAGAVSGFGLTTGSGRLAAGSGLLLPSLVARSRSASFHADPDGRAVSPGLSPRTSGGPSGTEPCGRPTPLSVIIPTTSCVRADQSGEELPGGGSGAMAEGQDVLDATFGNASSGLGDLSLASFGSTSTAGAGPSCVAAAAATVSTAEGQRSTPQRVTQPPTGSNQINSMRSSGERRRFSDPHCSSLGPAGSSLHVAYSGASLSQMPGGGALPGRGLHSAGSVRGGDGACSGFTFRTGRVCSPALEHSPVLAPQLSGGPAGVIPVPRAQSAAATLEPVCGVRGLLAVATGRPRSGTSSHTSSPLHPSSATTQLGARAPGSWSGLPGSDMPGSPLLVRHVSVGVAGAVPQEGQELEQQGDGSGAATTVAGHGASGSPPHRLPSLGPGWEVACPAGERQAAVRGDGDTCRLDGASRPVGDQVQAVQEVTVQAGLLRQVAELKRLRAGAGKKKAAGQHSQG